MSIISTDSYRTPTSHIHTINEGSVFKYELVKRVGRIQWAQYAQPIFLNSRLLGKKGDDLLVCTGGLSDDSRSKLNLFFDSPIRKFLLSDTLDWYARLVNNVDDQEQKIAAQSDFYNCSDHLPVFRDAFQNVMNEIYPHIYESTGCHWRVINSCALATKPNSDFGMYNWHTDGFPNAIRKILIFPDPLNDDSGTFEYEEPTSEGCPHKIETNGSSWIFCDVNRVKHRGRPPKKGVRNCLQVTIACAETADMSYKQLGLNAHYPLSPLIEQL